MAQLPFLYFDMGNVLLMFSHERMAAQMADVAGITPPMAWEILFSGDLGVRHETGLITNDQFYDEFLRVAGVGNVDRSALDRAACDIFWLNTPLVAMAGRLNAAGYRLGILSNTNDAHWRFVTERFAYLTELFHVHAMSFSIHVMKPDRAIYLEAAQMAGVSPQEVFYTDDRPENVEGAIAVGFDAVPFTSSASLSMELWRRGIRGIIDSPVQRKLNRTVDLRNIVNSVTRRVPMPIVKFVNEKKEIEVPEGANLRNEAIKAGINLNQGLNGMGANINRLMNCKGMGLCGTCRVLVTKGMDNTNKLTLREWLKFKTIVPTPVPDPIPALAYVGHEETMRLACCTTVHGDIDVESGPEINLFGENFFS